MTARRILVLTYCYPPQPTAGSNRWPAMAAHLGDRGHDVTIVTTSGYGATPQDDASVVRTFDLTANARLRRVFGRPPRYGSPNRPADDRPPPRELYSAIVPDPFLLTWVPFAVRAARRMLAATPFDCIVTSSPPESGHIVGLLLGRNRPAWLADFRDGWTFESWRPGSPPRALVRLDAQLERAVVTRADAVTAVTPQVADDFRRRFGKSAASVPNGWDPKLEADVASTQTDTFDDGRFTLLHTGKLTGPRGRTPGPLLEALRDVLHDDPQLSRVLRLLLVGPLDSQDRSILEGHDLGAVVSSVGRVPHREALALQRRADLLVLVTSSDVSQGSAKLVEYLFAGRPILALAENNDPARLVTETGTGVTVPPDDRAAIADALRRALKGELAECYAPRNLDQYRYPAPAVALEQAIEHAITVQAQRSRAASKGHGRTAHRHDRD